jgi:hypothetical protein
MTSSSKLFHRLKNAVEKHMVNAWRNRERNYFQMIQIRRHRLLLRNPAIDLRFLAADQ